MRLLRLLRTFLGALRALRWMETPLYRETKPRQAFFSVQFYTKVQF